MFLSLIFISLNIKNTLIHIIYLYCLHLRYIARIFLFDLDKLTNTQILYCVFLRSIKSPPLMNHIYQTRQRLGRSLPSIMGPSF
jgi:hypothetical protein